MHKSVIAHCIQNCDFQAVVIIGPNSVSTLYSPSLLLIMGQ